MKLHYRNPAWLALSRREFLLRYGGGLGGLALLSLLAEEGRLGSGGLRAEEAPPDPEKKLHQPRRDQVFDLKAKPPHFRPAARAVISLFMHGGPSHVDLMDPKPELDRHNGKEYQGDIVFSFQNRATRTLMASPFKFQRHGECGTPFSVLLPHTASIADDLAVVRSMYTGINGHEPSIWSMNTGLPRPGRPALGSWITYGLGCESQNLPAYIVLTDPGGLPVDGVRNWSQGWLPPIYQGTPIRPQEPRILNLNPPPDLKGALQEQQLELIEWLDRRHQERLGGDGALEARIQSYELAARLQASAQEALDLTSEPPSIRKLYGLDREATRSYGERCLLARRLVERGVRFVHILINGQIWDNHEDLEGNLRRCCERTDQPAAALVKDLKQRGLLDTTLVIWGGEIGRLPVVENHGPGKKPGRDHNGQGFSIWLAGGGIEGGQTYGETDEVGHKAAVDRVGSGDFHATLLYLLGLDHRRLTFFHNGRAERLTADHGPCRVVRELLKSPPAKGEFEKA
ncbi:MAG: DUF1501 domain-containing protein [Planctomycetes bacterium]|nr:DUF1501 domain-containing protein [Planctomycetota bacterium]